MNILVRFLLVLFLVSGNACAYEKTPPASGVISSAPKAVPSVTNVVRSPVIASPVSCQEFGIYDWKKQKKVKAGVRCVDNDFKIVCYGANAGQAIHFDCQKV